MDRGIGSFGTFRQRALTIKLALTFYYVPEIVELFTIKMHLSRVLAQTDDNRTLRAAVGSGGGPSSAIGGKMSAKRFCASQITRAELEHLGD